VCGRGSREGGRGSGEAVEAPLCERNLSMTSQEAREWLIDLLSNIRKLAILSPHLAVDEAIIDDLVAAVKVDFLWEWWLWRFVDPVVNEEKTKPITNWDFLELEKAGFDPGIIKTIIAIITPIVEGMKMFRSKNRCMSH
jgi:hypothetical protein